MHGRIKVKTTAEQRAAKLKEQEKKLKLFSAAWDLLLEKRKNSIYDKESLELSAQILCKIPDVHTLWNIRRETFLFLKSELDEKEYLERCRDELAFTEHCLQVNPKSYGCWEHRCWILDNSPDPDWARELVLCNRYLDLDERNFHCWDYRRFVVSRSGTKPDDEFKYTTDKISANFSNFSSWHYRSKLLPVLYPETDNPVGIRTDIVLSELNMVQNAFFTDPNDQSAWFYHRWLLGKADLPVQCDLVHFSPDRRRLLARFTKPVKTLESKISSGSDELNVVWKPVSLKSNASSVFYCDIPNLPEKCSVLSVRHKNEKFELKIDSENWVASGGVDRLAAIEFGRAAKEVLLNELEMLKQLHDLEPDNKWAMLTIISLVRNLDPDGAMIEVEKYLEKLIDVDPYRQNYYNDMRSKYVLENELRTRSESVRRNVDLGSRKLTKLYHSEHFLLVTELSLENNSLENLKGLHLLQNLKKCDASRNRIVSLDDMGVLPELEELNIAENLISERRCLSILEKQPKLIKVELVGNPIAHDVKTDDLINLLQKCPNE